MCTPTTLLNERHSTVLAFEPPVIRVYPHMLPQRTLPAVCFGTNDTLEVPLPGMRQHMLFHLMSRIKHFLTFGTLMPLLHHVVRPFMSCQILMIFESLVARRAFGLGHG